MNIAIVVDMGREALFMVLLLSGPLLFVGLIVGFSVGIFQAVTQINEMTLTFIPKILSIFLLLAFLVPWMALQLVDYTVALFERIPFLIK